MRRMMILAVLLAGCDRPPAMKKDALMEASSLDLAVHTDPATGCQYLRLISSGRELTARIAADGKTHMGCKGVQP